MWLAGSFEDEAVAPSPDQWQQVVGVNVIPGSVAIGGLILLVDVTTERMPRISWSLSWTGSTPQDGSRYFDNNLVELINDDITTSI